MVYPETQAMKKLLLSAFLGFATLALTPALSQAKTFGLFTGCGLCCCSKCTFCVRPYNAFTPVCSGNITCMGCCMPFAPQPNYGGLDYPGAGPGCPAPGYGGETILGQVQTLPALPPLPAPGGTTTVQPTPGPAPGQQPTIITPVPGTSMAPNPYGAVQANYRAASAPTYNPSAYYTYYGTVPYYWNAK
jgi:hypothetical protein